MKMTVETFKYLRDMIKNNPHSEKTKYYDGHKWTDPQGNWYGWSDCGYSETIFYAGDEWHTYTNDKGEMQEPVLSKAIKADEVKGWNVFIKYPNGDVEWNDMVGSEEEAKEMVQALYEEDEEACRHGCPPTGCEYYYEVEP